MFLFFITFWGIKFCRGSASISGWQIYRRSPTSFSLFFSDRWNDWFLFSPLCIRSRNAILEGGRSQMSEIQAIIRDTGALEYTAAKAREAADAAIDVLAPLDGSPFKSALAALAEFSVQRRS